MILTVMLVACMSSECAKIILKELERLYREELYHYNSLIQWSKIKLKPMHIVVSKGRRYIYLGRYWYRVEYKEGRVVWTYLGKEKPLSCLPDPPLNPLELLIVKDHSNQRVCIELKVQDPKQCPKLLMQLMHLLRKIKESRSDYLRR